MEDERVKEVLELQEQGVSYVEIARKYYPNSKTDKNKKDALRKYMKSRGYKLDNQKFVYDVFQNQISFIPGADEKSKTLEKQVKIKKQEGKQDMFTTREVEQLKEIINMKDELKEVIQKYNKLVLDHEESKTKQSQDINNNLDIDLSLFDAEVKNRVVKVYNNVNEEWKALSDQYRQYKQQDLISLALYEFIQKYKR